MRVLFCLLALLSLINARAQGQEQPNQINHWLQYAGTWQITSRWSAGANVQYRSYTPLKRLKTLFAGGEMGYQSKKVPLTLGMGYARLHNERYLSPTQEVNVTQEHRLYQQATLKTDVGKSSLSHRVQVEERWLSQGYQTRLRYLVGLQIPLVKAESSQWYGIFRNEIRVIVREKPFDSNRIFGGVGHSFTKTLTLEAMWMSQLAGKASQHQHFSMFILRHSFGQAE